MCYAVKRSLHFYCSGQKIACFAPENLTDSQAASLDEYCWNNGFWISEGVPKIKSLYTQPHRYILQSGNFDLYLLNYKYDNS